MDWSKRSSVSRIGFENDVDDIEHGIKTESIKIEPVVDDDETTLDLYPECQHRSDIRETIDISDDEVHDNDNQRSKPSRRSSRPIVYRVRVMCQSIETQTEIVMKDAETTTEDFERYLNANVAINRKESVKKIAKQEDPTNAINGESALGRSHEINNKQHGINESNVEEIVGGSNASTKQNMETEIELSNSRNIENGNAKTHKQKTEPKKKKKSTSVAEKKYYRCKICSCFYTYCSALGKHVQSVHKIKKAPIVPVVPFDAGCKFCKFKGRNTLSYNNHIKLQHKKTFNKSREISKPVDTNVSNPTIFEIPDILNIVAPKEQNILQTPKINKKKVQEKIIPKSVLFKCNKCSTHFLSCRTAVNHSDKCEKEEYKIKQLIVACRICQRHFYSQNIENHYVQHKHTDVFTTHELNEKRIDKYLYKCPTCQIYFNENKFKTHRNKRICIKNRSYQNMDCIRCNLKIADECYLDHERLHQAWKYVKDFFILIDVLLI